VKTLRAFWHWVDNDRPTEIKRDKLSKVALCALLHAESEVAARAFGPRQGIVWSWMDIWLLCSSSDGTAPSSRPEFFRPELVRAVRDLSLAICPALEAMHAAVPAAPPPPPPKSEAFVREYLADWLPAGCVPTDTFMGVNRQRDQGDHRLICPCRACADAREEAQLQAKALGVDVASVKVATHDGLVSLRPDPREPPSPEQQRAYQQAAQQLSAETQMALQQRNQYEVRAERKLELDIEERRLREQTFRARYVRSLYL
jgi:hypothetical protein